ncbi:uncharacterized protein LOC122005743 isoform X2 [Zingiber officinale]|uniref:uncharacterized protein LOC122005743 isoform X2 n=1 Tax=Zingiber officinale TaxID=94328 RepID=UPI001C4D1678|nr:uncharacterized protein LOC122005743 isoform X2 [Zingiber officinale]
MPDCVCPGCSCLCGAFIPDLGHCEPIYRWYCIFKRAILCFEGSSGEFCTCEHGSSLSYDAGRGDTSSPLKERVTNQMALTSSCCLPSAPSKISTFTSSPRKHGKPLLPCVFMCARGDLGKKTNELTVELPRVSDSFLAAVVAWSLVVADTASALPEKFLVKELVYLYFIREIPLLPFNYAFNDGVFSFFIM